MNFPRRAALALPLALAALAGPVAVRAAEPVKIGFLVKQAEEPWFQDEWRFAEQAAKDKGFTLSTSLEAALADPQVQAVWIATPHSTHRKLVEQAAAAKMPIFCEKLVNVSTSNESREKSSGGGAQLGSTGITDLATQLNAIQENFEKVQRVTPWTVLGLLLLLLIAVGPLDYLLVHRILRKPHLTWVTFPLLAALSVWSVSTLSIRMNGQARYANQLDIVDVDAVTQRAWGRHFVTLYSPVTTQTSISIDPVPISKAEKSTATCRVSWSGVPETTFGGMLRPTGIEQGAKYESEPDGGLKDLPVMQWSSKSLVAESVQPAEGLVDSDLRSSATGRLTGTLTHRLAAPIEDWLVVYKNVVYRSLKRKDDEVALPLPPNQVWRVEQPSVFSRELRPFMTGMITMATPRFGDAQSVEFVQKNSSYDSLSLDPWRLIRILTFHDEIGGDRYTGLSNQLLGDEDLSRLMKLDRAVLLGRLGQPVAKIRENGAEFSPERQASFVRLILPVARPTEVMKQLRRVVPD